MIEIKSVEFRNFLSYGDDPTIIEFTDLGPCLITGSVVGERDEDGAERKGRSNGAGKSTIVNAIVWCIFGRTMHSASPGDKVINWFAGKDATVRVVMKNGDVITRTRRTDGHTDLHYVKDGNEKNSVSNTLSTTVNQQAQLSKDFKLDWEVFAGSAFFTQYGKPWLEMADNTRKNAIERLLHIDRFTLYGEMAKKKVSRITGELDVLRTKIEAISSNMSDLADQINNSETNRANFEAARKVDYDKYIEEAAEFERRRDQVVKPDLEKLRAQWEIISKAETKIKGMRDELNAMDRKVSSAQGEIDFTKRRIKVWKDKEGKACSECERPIDGGFVLQKAAPFQELLATNQAAIDDLTAKRDKLSEEIEAVTRKVTERKPKQTLVEAKSIIDRWDQLERSRVDRINQANNILKRANPYAQTMDDASERLMKYEEDKKRLYKQTDQLNVLSKHYYYIQKAYSDRTKIKSNVLADHVPFVNERLRHYLDVFGLDIHIELTPALGIKSNLWGYEFESGGERKRTDVALMFAMFDLHESIYGRQCNVLVLDEVDGRMDEDGVNGLIDIVKNDMAGRAEAVLIISHKDGMRDVFPREISVTRKDRISVIEQR